MNDDEIVVWAEESLKRTEKRYEETSGPYTKSFYLENVVPDKHILRMVRLKADLRICWGVVDCVKTPVQRCEAGEHETCADHRDNCILCEASCVRN